MQSACGSVQPDSIATADGKAKTTVFAALSDYCGLPIVAIDQGHLVKQHTLTQSEHAILSHKTGSVSEAAALAAAGPGAKLIGPRAISSDGRATCALAEGSTT